MSTLTVQDLIEDLQRFDPSAEVRIAFHPSYPLAATVAAVTPDIASAADDDGFFDPSRAADSRAIVWIAASASVDHDENPHAPKGAWRG